MKRLLLTLILIVVLQPSSYAALTAHWTLQDNAGNFTVAAAVGSGGTLEGGSFTSAVSNTPGPSSTLTRYFLLDGTDDYVSATTGNTGATQNKAILTLCCWFKVASGDTTGNHRLIFANNGTVLGTTRVLLGINTSGQLACAARAGDGESAQAKTSSSSYDDNTWHHAAAVIDYANDTITLYIDGASVSSTGTISFTGSASSNTASLSVYLGKTQSGEFYKGGFADCRIYDSDESANLGSIMGVSNPVAKILLQLSDARLRRQSKHFATYGVYALTP
jgi:hypothetical protein